MSLARNIATRPSGTSQKGVTLGTPEFDRIKAIMKTDAGITIGDDKVNLVHSRLQKRMRQLGLTDFAKFCNIVEDPEGKAERHKMVNSLTTNLTNFFREAHHFEHLETEGLPPLIENVKRGGKIRIWSAGCSTGQEPYSIASTLLSVMPDAPNRNVKILASDIDSDVIQKARDGLYKEAEIKNLPDKLKNQSFEPMNGPSGKMFMANPVTKSIIAFRTLNLNASTWPMKGKFDIIFCRNTVIYFDAPTQEKIWTKFRQQMAPGSLLYIGHSERLSGEAADKFEKIGTTTYKLKH